MSRLDQQLRFVTEAGLLKRVQRQTMLIDPPRRENSAEHSWHLAVMVLALGEYAPPSTDLHRVPSMLLIEIRPGPGPAAAAAGQHPGRRRHLDRARHHRRPGAEAGPAHR